MADNTIWRETGGEKDYFEAARARELAEAEMISGLARCSVCGGAARVVKFGRDLSGEYTGVWVGCDKTDKCARNIEIHTEGWSVKDTIADWNRFNSGMYRVIRKVKGWFRNRFGKVASAEKRVLHEKKMERAKKRTEMMIQFGIITKGKQKKGWRFW